MGPSVGNVGSSVAPVESFGGADGSGPSNVSGRVVSAAQAVSGAAAGDSTVMSTRSLANMSVNERRGDEDSDEEIRQLTESVQQLRPNGMSQFAFDEAKRAAQGSDEKMLKYFSEQWDLKGLQWIFNNRPDAIQRVCQPVEGPELPRMWELLYRQQHLSEDTKLLWAEKMWTLSQSESNRVSLVKLIAGCADVPWMSNTKLLDWALKRGDLDKDLLTDEMFAWLEEHKPTHYNPITLQIARTIISRLKHEKFSPTKERLVILEPQIANLLKGWEQVLDGWLNKGPSEFVENHAQVIATLLKVYRDVRVLWQQFFPESGCPCKDFPSEVLAQSQR